MMINDKFIDKTFRVEMYVIEKYDLMKLHIFIYIHNFCFTKRILFLLTNLTFFEKKN